MNAMAVFLINKNTIVSDKLVATRAWNDSISMRTFFIRAEFNF